MCIEVADIRSVQSNTREDHDDRAGDLPGDRRGDLPGDLPGDRRGVPPGDRRVDRRGDRRGCYGVPHDADREFLRRGALLWSVSFPRC